MLILEHDKRIFERAYEDTGIEGFHGHDLRHTWASWHAALTNTVNCWPKPDGQKETPPVRVA